MTSQDMMKLLAFKFELENGSTEGPEYDLIRDGFLKAAKQLTPEIRLRDRVIAMLFQQRDSWKACGPEANDLLKKDNEEIAQLIEESRKK